MLLNLIKKGGLTISFCNSVVRAIINADNKVDLSQAEVAKIINKSQQGYSHIENGRAELKLDDLALLCRFYNVSADYIIGLTARPVPPKR